MDVRDSQTRVRGMPMDPYGYANVRPGNHTLSGSTLRVLSHHARGESSKRAAESSMGDARQERQLGGGPTRASAADFYVSSLPGLGHLATHPTKPLTMFAGTLPSYPGEGQGGGEGDTGKDAELFFMMIKARRNAGKQRVIFWFNGGPGCSSFDGSLMEIGPFRTVSAASSSSGQVELKMIDGGWEEYATVVFIDQPPGTGYSYVPSNGQLHELTQAAQHLIHFLFNFYQVFPELKGVDTYLAGESYAGQYIPYFGDALLKTQILDGFKLAGLAIGNGWIDPIRQYPGYADFAYEKGLIKKGSADADRVDQALAACEIELAPYPTEQGYVPANLGICQDVMDAVTQPFVQELNGRKVCMNVYDVRLVDDFPACGMNWPPDLSDVYTFLRRQDVVAALHATKHESGWVECDGKVSYELHNWESTASVSLIPGIVEAGVPVMIFAGAEDLICNYKGLELMLEHMEWNGQLGMGNATMQEWHLNGTQVGLWQEARNMTYVKVLDSSHMVGFDVPLVAHDMMLRFMGVDFSLVAGWEAGAKSSVGGVLRPQIGLQTEKEDTDKGVALLKGGDGDWESWYNAVSAFLILFILVSIVGAYFFFRRKGRARLRRGVSLGGGLGPSDREERVPLGRMDVEAAEEYADVRDGRGSGRSTPVGTPKKGGRGAARGHRSGSRSSQSTRKGKERASENEVMFALGDDEDGR